MATSSRRAGPVAEGSRVVTVAKQIQRSSLPGASAESIGRSYPMGATVIDGGVNFSLFSRTATGVELLLFDREDDASPSRVIPIDPVTNRTYHYWHVFVPGVPPGQIYGYRVEGPSAPAQGLRFDSAKVLLDPYGRGVVVPKNYDREAAKQRGRQRGDGDEKRGRRSERVRLGGRPPAEPALLTHHHLRDARPRIYAPPEFRGRREVPRHVRRADREDSLSASDSGSPPSSCCRCLRLTRRRARRAW